MLELRGQGWQKKGRADTRLGRSVGEASDNVGY